MSPPQDTTPVQEQIAELLGRVRAAHDARLRIPAVRQFWLEPQCHEIGCPCHTPTTPNTVRQATPDAGS